MRYQGIPVQKGVVIGFVSKNAATLERHNGSDRVDVDEERMRFFDALLEYESRMKKIAHNAPGKDASDIVRAQIMIARDAVFSDEVIAGIESGMKAEKAIDTACQKYSEKLRESGDSIFAERSSDLLEVKNGIISAMEGSGDEGACAQDPAFTGNILVSDALSVAQIIGLKNTPIKAVVLTTGTASSHAAVILRSMGIVSVLGAELDISSLEDGCEAIVDGETGQFIAAPTGVEKDWYKRKLKEFEVEKTLARIPDGKSLPGETKDGERIEVLCNLGTDDLPDHVRLSDGAGLVRTEILFAQKNGFPSEEIQAAIYARIADSFPEKNAVIRVLDIGGDKTYGMYGDELPRALRNKESEDNPALGIRGIRVLLGDEKLFRCQLTAILRASYGRKISILLPMITSVGEVKAVKELIASCMEDLDKRKISYDKNIRIGCMIETPAAVMCAEMIAKEVSFFSIGTNDLSQYIMCADRGNSAVSGLCSIYQNPVLRAVRMVCESAAKYGVPVTICGEAAAQTDVLPFFIGVGVRSFSVAPSCVYDVKKAVSGLTLSSCKQLCSVILDESDDEKIREILK